MSRVKTRRTRTGDGMSETDALGVQFVVVFVIAGAGSLLLSFLDRTLAPMLWALALMGVYLAAARARAPDRIRTEEFADSFYYLGFLLTLVALIGVLLRLGGVEENLLRIVLSQFGLALVTTLVGLAGRVVLATFRADPEDLEEQSRLRVEDAFDTFARTLQRMSAEADAFGQGYGGRLRDALGPIETTVNNFVAAVDDATERFPAAQERMDELSSAVGTAAHRVEISSGELTASMAGAGLRLEQMCSDLETRVGRAADALETASTGLSGRIEEMEAGFVRSLGVLEQTATAFAEKLEPISRGLQQIPAEIGAAGRASEAALAGLRADVDAVHEALARVPVDLTELRTAFASGRADVEASMAQWNHAVDEARQADRQARRSRRRIC